MRESTSTRHGWLGIKQIVLLGALGTFGPLSIDTYLPSLPELQRHFTTGPSQAQLTISACLLGLALGQVVAGSTSDARGRRGPLLIGLAGFAVTSILCATAESIYVLIGLRFLQGVTGAAGIVRWKIVSGPVVSFGV